jgi:hypothetical protein
MRRVGPAGGVHAAVALIVLGFFDSGMASGNARRADEVIE